MNAKTRKDEKRKKRMEKRRRKSSMNGKKIIGFQDREKKEISGKPRR